MVPWCWHSLLLLPAAPGAHEGASFPSSSSIPGARGAPTRSAHAQDGPCAHRHPRGDALPPRSRGPAGASSAPHLSAHRVGGIKTHVSPLSGPLQPAGCSACRRVSLERGLAKDGTPRFSWVWGFWVFFFLLFVVFFVLFFNVLAGKLKAVAQTCSGSAGLHRCHCRLPSAPSKARLRHPLAPGAGRGGAILLALGCSEGVWEAKPER